MVMNKAVAAAMLVLALVAASSPAVNAHRDHHGQIWRGHHGGAGDHGGGHHHGHGHGSSQQGQQHDNVLAGLTQCVTICGSGVTACMLGCYGPLINVDPVELPVCLLKCTNDAMVCASGCPVTGGGNN